MKTMSELAKEGILPEYAGMPVWADLLARITNREWKDVVWYVWAECDSGSFPSEPKENWPNVKDEHGPVISRDNFLNYLVYRNELPEIWAHYLTKEDKPKTKRNSESQLKRAYNNLLLIIAGMALGKYKKDLKTMDDRQIKAFARLISSHIELLPAKFGDDSIESRLKEAKELLETRIDDEK